MLVAALASSLGTPIADAQQPQFVTTLPPLYGTAGAPIILSAVAISAAAPGASQYQWDFGDGQVGVGQTTSHTYLAPGTYTVTLAALGLSGTVAIGTTIATIAPASVPRVGGVVPGSSSVASPLGFIGIDTYGPYASSVGVPLAFNATASNAGAPQFTWDFGDGQVAVGPAVTHAYGTAGTFTVRLTVFDQASGLSMTATTAATISAPPPFVGGSPPPAGVASPVSAGAPVVRYAAGWNLVAGPAGTAFPQALSPLFTWQPGDTTYESIRSDTGVQAGAGYWAYFPQPASVSLSGASTDTAIINLSPGENVLAGNPSASAAVVIHGADSAMAYDAASGRYRSVQALPPGGAAWVSIAAGGTVILSP